MPNDSAEQENLLLSLARVKYEESITISDDETEDLVSLKTDNLESLCQTGISPSLVEFGGVFNFLVLVHDANSKDMSYSQLMNKVFACINVKIPVDFSMDFEEARRHDLSIRALMVYAKDHSIAEPVKRCLHHSLQIEDPLVKHVLRCPDAINAQYYEDSKSGRLSVVVPVSVPQPGTVFVREVYQSTCQNSCTCGINRRKTLIVFTLEKRGEVVGRRVLPIRICCCPKRDRLKEEEKFLGVSEETVTSTGVQRKRRSERRNALENKMKKLNTKEPQNSDIESDDETYTFTISVKGSRNMRKMIAAFSSGGIDVSMKKDS